MGPKSFKQNEARYILLYVVNEGMIAYHLGSRPAAGAGSTTAVSAASAKRERSREAVLRMSDLNSSAVHIPKSGRREREGAVFVSRVRLQICLSSMHNNL